MLFCIRSPTLLSLSAVIIAPGKRQKVLTQKELIRQLELKSFEPVPFWIYPYHLGVVLLLLGIARLTRWFKLGNGKKI